MIFDLDGVLLDSESAWEQERRRFVADHGGRWLPESQRLLMGMSTTEWAAYLHSELGVQLSPGAIIDGVLEGMGQRYRTALPLIDGAAATVQRLASRWPLALASSSSPSLIRLALQTAGIDACFRAIVSSDEVARGKPAPDVYLEAANRLAQEPEACVGVEDSSNGLRAVAAAGMRAIAVPNRRYPPEPDALALAAAVRGTIEQVTVALIEGLG